jgi:hypothetical protein
MDIVSEPAECAFGTAQERDTERFARSDTVSQRVDGVRRRALLSRKLIRGNFQR